ncbi:MAG: hypothetical protein OEU26_04750 [Candidatus Tectomicrobia bacterium]|nr:hypothetical protein [Candidatus Tectomicrobia bacterium]
MTAIILSLILILGLFFPFTLLALALYQFYHYNFRKRSYRKLDLKPIIGFTEQHSVTQGDSIPIYIHTTDDANLKVYRLSSKRESTSLNMSIARIEQSNVYHHWKGFDWPPTLEIDTVDLQEGLYAIELRQNSFPKHAFSLPLIVSPKEVVSLALVSSTNTWDAYNAFGGLSNYIDNVTPFPLRLFHYTATHLACWLIARGHIFPLVPLPLRRPDTSLDTELRNLSATPHEPHCSHKLRAEWSLCGFLETHGIAHGLFTDRDWAFGHLPHRAKLVIFHAHSEYWSVEMVARLDQYLRQGGSVLFLSGNNIWQKVEFDQHGLTVKEDFDVHETARRIGAAFDRRGYNTAAGYRVIQSDHWVFNGLDLKDGDRFGIDTANRAYPDLPGASGSEVDKINLGSGEFTVLSIGENPGGGAFMVYRETGHGGFIFNAASILFTGGLGHDCVIEGIVKNLIEKALAPTESDSNALHAKDSHQMHPVS